jgi:hypothetical protein
MVPNRPPYYCLTPREGYYRAGSPMVASLISSFDRTADEGAGLFRAGHEISNLVDGASAT